MMRGGTIPDDLVHDVRTYELIKEFGGTPSQWALEDYHEIERLLAVKRAITRWHAQEHKSAAMVKGR